MLPARVPREASRCPQKNLSTLQHSFQPLAVWPGPWSSLISPQPLHAHLDPPPRLQRATGGPRSAAFAHLRVRHSLSLPPTPPILSLPALDPSASSPTLQKPSQMGEVLIPAFPVGSCADSVVHLGTFTEHLLRARYKTRHWRYMAIATGRHLA